MIMGLKAINKVIQPMGPLQPGFHLPSSLPRPIIIIIDLKDCYFSIPLKKEDREKKNLFLKPLLKAMLNLCKDTSGSYS